MPETGKVSGFFAIDRRKWARICGLGLNSAVAYLALARGPGKSNRETAWSVQAMEKYTGIARSRAHAAVQTLLDDGIVRQLRTGTRPKYDLVPWSCCSRLVGSFAADQVRKLFIHRVFKPTEAPPFMRGYSRADLPYEQPTKTDPDGECGSCWQDDIIIDHLHYKPCHPHKERRHNGP
jgi:hypothetical protein